MKSLFLVLCLTLTAKLQSQTPGKDPLFLYKVERTKTTTYSNGSQSQSKTVFYDYKLGEDGFYQRVDKKAKNLYQVVKIFPDAAQKIIDYRRLRKKNNVLSALNIFCYVSAGVGGGLYLFNRRDNKLLAYSGIGIGAVGITGIVITIKRKSSVMSSAQRSIEESVDIYNSQLKS